MSVYAYTRVSTGKQDNQHQVIEILNWVNLVGITIDEFVSDESSSRKSDNQIVGLIARLQRGDIIVCCDLSRLSCGGIGDTFAILQKIKAVGAELVAVRDTVDTRKEYACLTSEILSAAASISLCIERNKINERTKAGLEAARQTEKKLGRKPIAEGGKTSSMLDERHREILAAVEAGVPLARLAKRFACSRVTMSRFVHSRGIKTSATSV